MINNKKYRDFLLVWLGQTISILGSSLTWFGFVVWLFDKTGTAMPFVITGLAIGIPRMILSPMAGSLADRYNRRWIMIFSDTGSAVMSLILFLLFVSGQFDVWLIYLSVLVGSIFGSFQTPAYMAATATMVPEDKLVRFGGISQFGDAAVLLLTPILGVTLYGTIGLGGIIIFDLVTYIIAVSVLIFIRLPQPELVTQTDEIEKTDSNLQTVINDFKFSWKYLVNKRGLFGLLWFGAGISFFAGISGMVTSPLILSFGNEKNLGIIQVSSGIVLLISGFLMSVWGGPKKNRVGTGILAIFFVGVGNLIIGVSPFFNLVVIGMAINTFFDPISSSLIGAIWQMKVPHDIQGRIFSMRIVIGRINNLVSTILSGILADYVFVSLDDVSSISPFQSLNQLAGFGPGRQFALVFVISALGICILSLVAFFNKNIRQVEYLELNETIQSNVSAQK